MKNKSTISFAIVFLIFIGLLIGRRNEDVTLSSPSAEGGNHPPTITRIEIAPSAPDLKSVLSVQLVSEDPDRDRVTYRYRWFVNKKEVGDQPVLPLTGFHQGDLVSVEVIPSDGKTEGSPAQSPVVRIGNNPPSVRAVKLSPEALSSGQSVHAEVEGFDKEGDPIHYDYEWYINDRRVDGNVESDLDGAFVHSSDRIAVKVIPSDPFSQGEPKMSNVAVVVNHPPEITSLPPTEAEEGKYTYQVIAKDPDGDPLHYSLVEAPPEMSIHPTSGLLEWNVAKFPTEGVSVKVQVDDAKGGKSIQQFVLRAG